MRIQVRLGIKSNDDTSDTSKVILDTANFPKVINVAHSELIAEDTSAEALGAAGFQLSPDDGRIVSKLDGSRKPFASTGYPGVCTSRLSINDDDAWYIDIPFKILGKTPENLDIRFDSIVNEYAVEFSLTNEYNNKTITVTDNKEALVTLPLESLALPETLDNVGFTLKITKWSIANASVKLTMLSTSTYGYIVYNGKDLQSVSISENLFDSQMQIVPGICEQYADIKVYDRNNVLRKLAANNKLHSDYLVNIIAIDDTNAVTYQMGTYIVSDWNFDGISSDVGITCRDKSYLFEKIDIERSTIADRTLDELLNILFSQASNLPWKYQDDDTRAWCASVHIPNSWYLASDLYTMLNKVCALGMLRIYWYVNAFVVGRCS